ncbi:MAG: DoxX family protein, partial [Planctomycetaceae bacterium]
MLLASPKQISIGLLLLRLSLGSFMLVHGMQKVMNFTALSEAFPDPIGLGSQLSLILAVAAEVGCSLLLMIGLLTRLSALGGAALLTLFYLAMPPWPGVQEIPSIEH